MAPTLLDLDQSISLGPDQGILVVEVEASEEVLRLVIEPSDRLGSSVKLTNLAEGRRARLLVMPAGSYRWGELDMQGNVTINGRTYPDTWIMDDRDDHWQFSVRPGVVNYPGVLVLDRVDQSRLRMYTLNRSAQLVQTIRAGGGGLLTAHPFAYSGRGRDDFLEFYASKLRSEHETEQTRDASAAVSK